MTTFVLVHGAWHGAWCWHKTAPQLEKQGHRVLAPDLPGHGADATPAAEIGLAEYVERVLDSIAQADGEVVLVGHSMGGLVISAAAESAPDKIRRLVYLAAMLPTDGESFSDIPAASRIAAAVEATSDGAAMLFRSEFAQDVFYGDCSDADVAFALERICPQPLGLRADGVRLSDERFGRVPREYIECLRDRAIEVEDQRAQYERTPCSRVYTLDSSHSPFFSMPERLATLLDEIAY